MMLPLLPGDVLRLVAGHMTSGGIDGQEATQVVWPRAVASMVVVSLTVPYPAVRRISNVALVLFVIFNRADLPGVGWHHNSLIVVSFAFNGLIIWYALTWVPAAA